MPKEAKDSFMMRIRGCEDLGGLQRMGAAETQNWDDVGYQNLREVTVHLKLW